MLIKECNVILHNDLVAVVLFDGKEIQVPNSKLIGATAYVKFENEKYTIVSKDKFDKFNKKNIDKKELPKIEETCVEENIKEELKNSELLDTES